MTTAELKHLLRQVSPATRKAMERHMVRPALKKIREATVGVGNIGGDEPIDIELPIRTATECNAKETIWAKHRRAKRQREAVNLIMGRLRLPSLPVLVTLTRYGPRLLDSHDNLPSSPKHIVDEIASLYGREDNAACFVWKIQQEKRKAYGVGVRIERRV